MSLPPCRSTQEDREASDSSSASAGRSAAKSVFLNHCFQGTVATEDHFKNRLSVLAEQADIPISVYLHIPFSPYQLLTDETLNVASHGNEEVNDYINAIEREIEQITQRIGQGRHISQLHLGGSAPNSISQKHLVRIQDIIERHFHVDETTETSLVADPGRTSFAQMDLLTGLGFQQVNYGICDLDPKVQEAIGRVQSPELIKESFQASREAGFELITSDLLYGIPNQTVSSMQSTIERYLDLQPDRIVCRCFSNNTARASNRYSPKHLTSLADRMATFHTVVEGLTSQGYEWIGLDCFARLGDPLTSQNHPLRRNRIGYSAMASSDTLGFGSNAISEVAGVSVQNHARIDQWAAAVGHGRLPVSKGIKFSGQSLRRRQAMTDLMCNMQTDDVASLVSDEAGKQQIQQYQQDGVIEISGDTAKVTAGGQFFLSQLWDDVFPSSLPQ